MKNRFISLVTLCTISLMAHNAFCMIRTKHKELPEEFAAFINEAAARERQKAQYLKNQKQLPAEAIQCLDETGKQLTQKKRFLEEPVQKQKNQLSQKVRDTYRVIFLARYKPRPTQQNPDLPNLVAKY